MWSLITSTLVMEVETVSETLGINFILSGVVARVEFTASSRQKSYRSHIGYQKCDESEYLW
jgi:hypothetical protein